MDIVEIWKDIPGYEGCYQASNFGKIRSVTRVVTRKNHRGTFNWTYQGKQLTSRISERGYRQVSIYKSDFSRVHPYNSRTGCNGTYWRDTKRIYG